VVDDNDNVGLWSDNGGGGLIFTASRRSQFTVAVVMHPFWS